MVHPQCLLLLVALFIGAECLHMPLQLKKHEATNTFDTDTKDLVRPRRTIYAYGGGDRYMMSKLADTNTRLSTIEGSLFRIENILNFLQAGGAIPVPHVAPGTIPVPHVAPGAIPVPVAATVIRAPVNGGHVNAANTDIAPHIDAPLPASRSAAFGGGHPMWTHGSMPLVGLHQNIISGMHQGLQPPQFQHNFQPQPPQFQHNFQPQPPQFQHNFQPQFQPLQLQPQSKNAIDTSSQPKSVHWMDSTCSVPCGVANVPRQARGIPNHITRVRHIRDALRFIRDTDNAAVDNGTAAAPAPGAAAVVATQNAEPDAIEVNQMRVVGGEESMKHKYPWQVYIQIYLSVGGVARCGGSIINDRYVITAGHCTYTGDRACAIKVSPDKITVTVAEHNINSINDDIRGATDRIDVKRIIRHPKYCASNIEMDNDVALLRLAEVLVLPENEEIGHICLPGGPLDSFSGMTATVAGWGYKEEDFDERDHTDLAGKLQEVDFKIHPDCSTYPNPEDITENMICAGDEKNIKDACGGDSGGPLMVQKDGRYTLAGLVSFGPDGGDCTGEGVYVKLANYIQWIRENTMDAEC